MRRMNSLKSNNMINLNPIQDVYNVIGCVCNNLDLIRDTSINIEIDDFVQNTHKVTFAAVKNIAIQSPMANSLSARDVDNYLSAFEGRHATWLEQKGFEYVQQCIDKSNEDTFDLSYKRVRKMSLLREFVNEGIDITDLYNYTTLDSQELDEQMTTIDRMTMSDIIEHFSVKQLRIKDKYNVDTDTQAFKVGEGLDALFERLEKGPDYGIPFDNAYYNALFRGMGEGRVLLQSASTGSGKTRNAIKDACEVSASHKFNIQKQRWDAIGVELPSLLISTELEEDEVNILMLAYISGIPQKVIQDSNYDNEVANRLYKAREVLENAEIYCVVIKDFSIRDIEDIIERHIIEKQIVIAAFDYIQMRPKLQRSLNEANGGAIQREDQVLQSLAEALKDISEKYKIFIRTSTQLNRNVKDNDKRDADSLAGGRATANKVDFGIIVMKTRSKDIKSVDHILSNPKWGNREPNYMHWVYKNRQGEDNVIVWTQFNLANLREEICFVTDFDYNLKEDIVPEYYTYDRVENEEDEGFESVEYEEEAFF